MVEYALDLNNIFRSLADPTRRDMLHRVSKTQMTIGELAKFYDMTFAAVSKHLKVLESANLITKQRRGKEQIVTVAPATLREAADYLQRYETMWQDRFGRLDDMLNEESLWQNPRKS
jgi:DNA-binding transcriptional ArsR family regulator